MHRLAIAFRSFFALLFDGFLPGDLITELGLVEKSAIPKPAPPPPPAPTAADGALQLLGILQRDGRLLDFLMEDIATYSDDQVGAAVRGLHGQSRESLDRYVKFQPVIDGVEGTFAKTPAGEPGLVKFIGNVPAGTPKGGTLRHRGWRATSIQLPPIAGRSDVTVVAPAEIEIE